MSVVTPQELSQMPDTVSNAFTLASAQWIPAIAGIVGALVGATASILPNLVLESRRIRDESRLIESSLIAEMTALVEIAVERGYLTSLEQMAAYLETQPDGTTVIFQANIPRHYSRIYQENASRIGLIEKNKATDIIRFHQLVDAVVQDVTDGGVLSGGGTLKAFVENHKILARAFEISRQYSART